MNALCDGHSKNGKGYRCCVDTTQGLDDIAGESSKARVDQVGLGERALESSTVNGAHELL
jgi:hypothetical protein